MSGVELGIHEVGNGDVIHEATDDPYVCWVYSWVYSWGFDTRKLRCIMVK